MIYGNTHSSWAQKIVMMTAQTVILAVAFWLLLFGGLEWLSRTLHLSWAAATTARRAALFIGFCVVYLRIAFTGFYLLKRAMGWQEAASIPFAFMLYYLGFSLFAGAVAKSIGPVWYVGIALFLLGSCINTGSEILRDRWKSDPAHTGRLYTGGLFRWAMHINYFGDIVWVGGLAMMTENPWSAVIPALLFCFFAFMNAPLLDSHLAEKYPEEFAAYRTKTKRIIPFIY